jgi:hypothetical protein
MTKRIYKPTGKPVGRPASKPVGRPRLTLNDFPKGWEQELLRMGSEGMLDVDIKVYLNISNDTFARLLVDEPQFLEVVSRMRSLSHAWWVAISRNSFASGTSKQVNSQLYSLILRNRFKDEWNAENKVDITSGGEKIDSNKKIEIEIVRKLTDGEQDK